MLRVITGRCLKNEGFLFVTGKTLTELAKSMNLHHIEFDNKTFFHRSPEFTATEKDDIIDGDAPKYTYEIFITDCIVDINLNGAVCW